MQGYEERVIAEKADLDEKIVKLTSFLFSDRRDILGKDDDSFRLMQDQLTAMMCYSTLLRKRIKKFKL